jgi:hypothetical protein
MSNLVSLWISEADMNAGHFRLADLVDMLPDDAAIMDTRHSYSSAHVVMRVSSSQYPVVKDGDVPPRADFSYNSIDGMRISWPSSAYERPRLEKLNKKIEEAIKPEPTELDLGKIFEAYAKASARGLDGAQVVVDAGLIKGCDHQWFMYGRTSSHKHCKKCGAMKENVVDKD